jgi:hypothetical protein
MPLENRPMRQALVSLSALVLLASPALARTKLAILGIEGVDEGDVASQEKTAAAAKQFTEALRSRVSGLSSRGFVVPPNSMRELSEVKIIDSCLDESIACMAQAGKTMGADKVLYGKLDKVKGGYTLTVKLLNIHTKQLERSPKSLTVTPAELADEAQVKQRAAWIFAEVTGIELTGSLTVKANATSGTVYVGGEPKGELAGGYATVTDIPEGSVLVSVEAEGFKEAEQEVAIHAGKPAEVEFTLEQDPSLVPPPAEDDIERPGQTLRVAGWGFLGTAAVTGSIGLYLWFVRGEDLRDQAKRDAEDRSKGPAVMDDPTTPADESMDACRYQGAQDACDEGKTNALIASVVGWGVTGACVAASALFLYLGYTAEPARRSAQVGTEPRTLVMPYVSPDGVGFGATLRF